MATIDGTQETDILRGTPEADQISALGRNDLVSGLAGGDRIFGGADNDILLGNRGRDTLVGGSGDDSLYGGLGGDRLFGSDGNDLLFGNLGSDTLTGGSGNDLFVLGPTANAQIVTDFNDGSDLIGLDGIEFAELELSQTGDDVLLQEVGTGDVLAIIENFAVTSLTAADFTTSIEPISELPPPPPPPTPAVLSDRASVSTIEFLGEISFETGTTFDNTEVGGLSGIIYDPENDLYYALADDRSQTNDARFYTLTVDLDDTGLNDITFTEVTTLLNAEGQPFEEFTIDPEGIAFADGNLFISSEGVFPWEENDNQLIDPFINRYSLAGEFEESLVIPEKFLPTEDGSAGIHSNLAFDSLTVTPDGRFLYTATENALIPDGPVADLENESPARILQYDLTTGFPVGEFLYFTDPIPVPPDPADGFSDNGLVDLFPLDNSGTLLALERSFASGVGNNIRLYEVRLQGATDISNFNLLVDPENPDEGSFDVDQEAVKRLLLDFGELGIDLDNSEGMTFGPVLPDGRQSLIVVSDNNFSDNQTTQFLAFALDINTIPAIAPTLETPSTIRIQDPGDPDADDPAIYLHPEDPSQSFVITALKNAGLAVYDLNGEELQAIIPEDIRYNNVDIVYGFELDGEIVDLAVASDRRNDTLAIYQINPDTRQLNNITADDIPETIFGVDDGEQTAYGLATYTSPISGNDYIFVTQRDGNLIAQLELVDNGAGEVTASVLRTLELPVPTGDPEDSQSEGIVIDRERGIGYVALEDEVGILKFNAEPDAGDELTVVQPLNSDFLTPDIEGLTIYYGPEGTGYLIASSQGDNTYPVFRREGNNEYLGSFVLGAEGFIDGVEESDGLDIINVPLGSDFPSGLLVVQDGSNEPADVFQDPEDGEIQNFNTNFKFVDWEAVANAFSTPLIVDDSFDLRNPLHNGLINGIASGDTTQDSTILWARSTFPGDVVFEYSTEADFSSILGIETVVVTDPTLPAKVEITGLDAGTDYFYRVIDATENSAIGQFKTPAEMGVSDGVRFGVSGDLQGELAPFVSISNADERDLDFFVHLGDTIEADSESPALPEISQATTLEEFRIKHSEVHSERFGLNAWADLRSATTFYSTWDDHDLTNDFAGGAAPADSDEIFGEETEGFVNDTPVFDAALQAFQEYKPLRDEFYGDTEDPRTANEQKLYRNVNFGSDVSMFVLDVRSFRDAPLAFLPETASQAEIEQYLMDAFAPGRTMLGDVQLQELKDDLVAAEEAGVTWKFIMSTVPMQNFGIPVAGERWEGFAAERTDLLSFIEENEIENVVFVTGDFHGTTVNNVTYQEEFGGEQIPTGVFDIMMGPTAIELTVPFLPEPFNETFAAPFGPATVGFTPESLLAEQGKSQAEYLALTDRADRDQFVREVLDFRTETLLGYDPIGLEDSGIDATLIEGEYIAAHTYGWTEFDVAPGTQELTVTTYGVEPYTQGDLLANPEEILSREPMIVSQFEVMPVI